ncbi:MAG: hypothetical protein RMJ15_03425 [Nitrososphaerota archaeon]|nr:hypothetical protein [Candidatus Bathyarchaeota archaeon]MDW8022777.1 hypothetical protein [Nitrososphaerota archaeon]
MSLDLMDSRGIKLPPREKDVSGLTDVKVIDKIRGFWERYRKEANADNEFAPVDFLELLEAYPVSMCSYHMTDSLKLLVALMYFESREKTENSALLNDYEGLSMDYLALIFDRSKKTIHDAIKEKEAEAKRIIGEAKLRKEAREIALRKLIEEEKAKLKQKQEEDRSSNKPKFG